LFTNSDRAKINFIRYMISRTFLGRVVMFLGMTGLCVNAGAAACLAQSGSPVIPGVTRKVALPVEVIQTKTYPVRETDVYGKQYDVYNLRSEDVSGLSAKSFHILEDGKKQEIEEFRTEPYHAWAATDNGGQHVEYSCSPAGIWGGPDTHQAQFYEGGFHTYLLTYAIPPSPEGSCHRIKVSVDDRHAKVFAPNQYCNREESMSDPLNGVSLGNRMLQFAKSSGVAGLPLAVQVTPFATSSGAYRVSVSATFPASRMLRQWGGLNLRTSIAVLGLVYDNHNLLVYRFSDLACLPRENFDYDGPEVSAAPVPMPESLKLFEKLVIPTTYQTQMVLNAGIYRIVMILTDGRKFGRAIASLHLDEVRKEPLAVSGIALCRRYRSAEPRSPSQAPQYVPLESNGTEFTPAGDRRFRKGKPIISYFEVYGMHLEDSAVTLHLQVKVIDAKTGEIKLDSGAEPLKFSSPPKNNSAPVVRNVLIDTLPQGSYRFEAQVSDSEGRTTAWSSTSFTVLH
jgi:hypothetical protein